jgi:hypothetical protein
MGEPMNHASAPPPVRVLRTLEKEIRSHRRKILRLECERDLLAAVFRLQARDDRGRFLPTRRGAAE